jgi:hypothetical protein
LPILITGKKALKLLQKLLLKTTQKLTFKDFGVNVGISGENWRGLASEDFNDDEAEANRYVVSANNKSENKKSLPDDNVSLSIKS